jgi:DAACS family dicarboxylate/amino acid:cation (Na+ or H+) symporter
MQVVKTFVPVNPAAAVAGENPNMLHLMFFALILGIAATTVDSKLSHSFVKVMDSLFALCTRLIDIIMLAAPYAAACLLFNNLARFGVDLLGALGWFVATVLLGLSLHMFGVYSLSVYFLSRLNPITFFKRIKLVMLTAFSTSSSNATLPTTLIETERNLGVPREIGNFVLRL